MILQTAILALATMALSDASALQAQQQFQLNASMANAGVTNENSTSVSTPAATGEPSAADLAPVPASAQGGGPIARTSQDNEWHLSISPYLWFPGVHGTVGALDREAGFRASPSDLLSHFKFGLMGAVEARRNRLLVPIDMMWIRLEDDKALPFPPALEATSANLKATEFILTPKIGVRLINGKKLTADFLTGIRYWHFGEGVQFTPSALGFKIAELGGSSCGRKN